MVVARHIPGEADDRVQDLKQQVMQLKSTETRLRHSEQNLKAAERLAKLGHWELDIVNNRLVWSDEIFRIFEIDPDVFGATYETFLAAIHPEDRQKVNETYTFSLKNRLPYSITHRLLMSDGRVKIVREHCATEFDENGVPLCSLGTVHDITDQTRHQEEQLKSQKLEAIGTLAGGIAHDFNNLLVGILGNLELATEDSTAETEKHGLLDSARKAALRAREVVRQLLIFAHGGDPVRETTDMSLLVREVVDFFCSGTSVGIEYHFADDLWWANVDPGQLSQVLQNLVLNAIEALDGTGTLIITCTNCRVAIGDDGPLSSGKYVEITVCDDGPGMPSDVAERVFEPYFTTKSEGCGLGLAMVRSIIRKHGGDISLATIPGQGTTFTVILPVRDEALPRPSEQPQVMDRSLHILIVDDEEMVGDLSARMAENLGHRALYRGTSKAAVETYREALAGNDPIDLVILDLTMPGDHGGLWIFEELKKWNPEVRAVVSSGYSADGAAAQYSDYGFVGALLKPFTKVEMGNVIAAAFENDC